jgi:hypothetical protein
MNRKLIFLVLLVCLLAFVAVMAFSQTSSNTRWEYGTFSADADRDPTPILNQLGLEGWELVSVPMGSGSYSGRHYFYLKRRLP